MPEEFETRVLPFTSELKNPNWSYLYAYNIRTLRDIFVYTSFKEKIEENILYNDINEKIPPPKNRWINPKTKKKERLILEYIHAAKYLGFIKKENNLIIPNFEEFKVEKNIIIEECKERQFTSSQKSPPFTPNEKKALFAIVLNYERAKDFLRWFLDLYKYRDMNSFDLADFKKDSEPIFLLGKIEKGRKGSTILKRASDNKIWKIPFEKPDDYTRITSNVFTNWFRELGLIDKLYVFPEFSEDKQLWHMYYPIKINKEQFLERDIKKILNDIFLKDSSQQTINIWIPHLIYIIATKFFCPVDAIKAAIEKAYKEDFSHFHLGRTSFQVMKKHSTYKESYINVDGFYRSTLKIVRE